MGRIQHGAAKVGHKTPEWRIWVSMRERCRPTADDYKYYGGRGIKVCDRWRDSFTNFLADMGLRPEGMTLDRINNEGNYEPGNCRWASRKVQRLNQSSRVYMISFRGETHSLKDWSLIVGINYPAIKRRNELGWPVELMLTKPLRQGRYKRLKDKQEINNV